MNMLRSQHKSDQQTHRRARQLRNNMTHPEWVLWKVLRGLPKESGIVFRRQHPIGSYVVDFVCLKRKMVVELDGPSHDSQVEHDRQRQLYLERLGYVTLRFANSEVMKHLESVVQTILATAKEEQPPTCEN